MPGKIQNLLSLPKRLTMTFRLPLLTTVLIIILLPACNLPDKPVTSQEALDLAHHIERSVTTGDATFLDNIFEPKHFTQRILDAAHEHFNLTLAKEAKNAITEAHWGRQIINATRGGGTYSLVRQYEKDGHQHLLFRLFEANSALNYHDFELTSTDKGIKALDVYIYLTGEDLSKSIAESIVLLSDKLSAATPDDQTKIQHIRKINELIQNGAAGDAAGYYNQLPPDLQKEKPFQVIHLRIAMQLGDTAYVAALREYKANFPNDPSLGLLMFDAYVMDKDYRSALAAIDRLDSTVGKDPLLDYFRALLYKVEQEPAQARSCLLKLHAALPRFGKGTVELLANYANAGNPDSAAMLVRQAQADSNITTDQIRKLEDVYPTIRPYLK
jgi:hypothetical protein